MNKENLTKFYQTYKLYIFPAVVALSSLFLTFFVILPQTVKLITNQQAADGFLNRTKILETKVSALESFNNEDLSQKLRLTLASFPADRDYGNILGLVQQLVSQSGFSLESITLGTSAQKFGSSDSFGVKLNVKGPRLIFPILLNNLESSTRLLRVTDIDVSSGQNQFIDAAIVLDVLYSGLPKGVGTIDSPLPELSQKDEELINALTGPSNVVAPAAPVGSSSKGKLNPFE